MPRSLKDRWTLFREFCRAVDHDACQNAVLTKMNMASPVFFLKGEHDKTFRGYDALMQARANPAPTRSNKYFYVEEKITLYDQGQIFHEVDTPICIANSFLEAAFEVQAYNERMRVYGLKPVMASDRHAAPNIGLALQEIKDRNMHPLAWPDRYAHAAWLDRQKAYGSFAAGPRRNIRLMDCPEISELDYS